jgi:hypothetical protein
MDKSQYKIILGIRHEGQVDTRVNYTELKNIIIEDHQRRKLKNKYVARPMTQFSPMQISRLEPFVPTKILEYQYNVIGVYVSDNETHILLSITNDPPIFWIEI